MKPSLIVQIQTIITSKQEETCHHAIQCRRLEMIVTLSNSQRLFHQQVPRHEIRTRQTIESKRITRYTHPRLDHHKRTKRCQETIRIGILIGIHRLLFESSSVENGKGGIHVRKEEFNTLLDHIVRKKTWSRCQRRTTWRTAHTVHSIRDFGGEGRLSLCFSQFTDDFGPRTLGPLLLWDGVVGTYN